jgi:hypothetical protein
MAWKGWALAILAFAAVALSGCGRQSFLESDQRDPADAGLFSLLHAADPQAARQLLDGFYPPEQFGRWTKPKFSIVLAVPHTPALQDPTLLVKLFIPDNEMAMVKSLTLSASANGTPLAPETFTAPGAQVYVRSLPAAALTGDRVQIDCKLDKWMPATVRDNRDLGIVVTVAGLKSGAAAGF